MTSHSRKHKSAKRWSLLQYSKWYVIYSGQSAGVFEAYQLILLAVFGAVDEPLASCVMVQF